MYKLKQDMKIKSDTNLDVLCLISLYINALGSMTKMLEMYLIWVLRRPRMNPFFSTISSALPNVKNVG